MIILRYFGSNSQSNIFGHRGQKIGSSTLFWRETQTMMGKPTCFSRWPPPLAPAEEGRLLLEPLRERVAEVSELLRRANVTSRPANQLINTI